MSEVQHALEVPMNGRSVREVVENVLGEHLKEEGVKYIEDFTVPGLVHLYFIEGNTLQNVINEVTDQLPDLPSPDVECMVLARNPQQFLAALRQVEERH